ncbi:hypothetical protein HanRHA438_Chr09g0383091 [Helianthus annuus]|nr:hypothetical protein HanRHA438_Chr09g0383091 [Helianthus annuus]
MSLQKADLPYSQNPPFSATISHRLPYLSKSQIKTLIIYPNHNSNQPPPPPFHLQHPYFLLFLG